ncbi:hypothetical protein TWF730_008407 [Orbilia blumenaviensis]|uniref:Uncharacterized protein n=1 Tax=Orbilia blumenaviensis TaxID=1796055 RepID=A0AAV9V4X8_9PEZI
MKVSTLFFAASLLVSASAQEDEPGTTILTADPITSSSTTEAVESTVTLPAASCSSLGFEYCYRIIEVLTPTVYVIITADDPATVTGAEPITSGDPILTQTDNIASSGESISAPTTAVVGLYYSQTSSTTCDPATITSVLADDGDMECIMASAPFFSAPGQVTKTRVIRKAQEDDTQGKGTETSDGGAGQTTAAPAPGSTTDSPAAVTTTDPAPEPTSGGDTPTEPAPTDEPAPTTEDNSQPTEEPTDGPTEEPTGKNESAKPEVSTAFTTIAETSGGTTKFVTSAVATMTRSAPSPSTSDGDSGAGSNFLVKAQVLFGAVGLAAVVGL